MGQISHEVVLEHFVILEIDFQNLQLTNGRFTTIFSHAASNIHCLEGTKSVSENGTGVRVCHNNPDPIMLTSSSLTFPSH